MCDICDARCIICGEYVEMHLEDYDTLLSEIAVFHKECFKQAHLVFNSDAGKIVVVSLTENAVNHKAGNCPNCSIDGMETLK